MAAALKRVPLEMGLNEGCVISKRCVQCMQMSHAGPGTPGSRRQRCQKNPRESSREREGGEFHLPLPSSPLLHPLPPTTESFPRISPATVVPSSVEPQLQTGTTGGRAVSQGFRAWSIPREEAEESLEHPEASFEEARVEEWEVRGGGEGRWNDTPAAYQVTIFLSNV